ncbi:MAG: YitT family protein [Desulfuromonadales bacterium]|nr:YitT family protein [Desulfuromonadales bacterium]
MTKIDPRAELKNAACIVLGSAALALGVVLFLIPNRIATGGTPGMAILLHHLTALPAGVLMVAINVPLLLAGFRYLGGLFAVRTVFAILVSSLLVDLFAEVLQLGALSDNTMLATLYGGIAVGIGVGLILRGNASAGGSTAVARIVSFRSSIKPGQVILFIDMLIIVCSGIVFQDIERALWSLISIYVTARCIDMVLTGAPSEKIVHIVSERVEQLSEQIIRHLGSSGTVLSGTGLHRDEKKTMIFVVVEGRRITLLRDIIRDNDPQAFMVVMEASEMLGRGHGRLGP